MALDSGDGRRGIGLVLIDDHLLFRESLAKLLAEEGGFQIIGQAENCPDAFKFLKTPGIDVILVDLSMAEEFILIARKARYAGKFLVIARSVDALGSAAVLRSGASGIFLESDSSVRLMQAIRQVANGETWLDQTVIKLLAELRPTYQIRALGSLSAREQSVLSLVVDGMSNRRIGDQMGLSESSIKATLQQLFMKAGVRTRSQLVRIALEDHESS